MEWGVTLLNQGNIIERPAEDFEVITSLEKLEEIRQLPDEPIIETGFKTLDEMMEGMVSGELIILTGGVKSGKSLLMRSMINNLYARYRMRPLVFSYEEMPKWFFRGFDNMTQDIVFYMPRTQKASDVDWLIHVSKKAIAEKGVKIIFIDHGHYLFNLNDNENTSRAIGGIARKLKYDLAVAEGVIVIVIWHIKHIRPRSAEELTYDLIRDSGLIAGELDTCIGMFRKVESNDIVQTEESKIKLLLARRSGALDRIIPVKKEGNYLRECIL